MSNRNVSAKSAAPATTNGNTAAKASQTPVSFRATFIAANNGLQTEQRVHGRRGFPDRTGHQPQLGETWMVTVSGENPKRTVHFVKCLELVAKAKPVTTSGAAPASDKSATASVSDKPATASVIVKTAPKVVRPQFMAGQLDVVQRVRAWLAPAPTTADLSNLRFAVAHKRSSENAEGISMRWELAAALALIDAVDEQVAAISLELDRAKKFGGNLHGVSFDLFEARRDMARLVDDKAALNRQTLDYARLVKRVNALNPDAEIENLTAQKDAAKEALDTKRAAHKSEMEAGKSKLSDAELAQLFSSDSELVDTLSARFAEKEKLDATRSTHVASLSNLLTSFENYVSSMA